MAELKGLSPDAEIVTNTQGGKQSKVEHGFHLCDYGALFALAEVLQYGASRYERDNWRKIPAEEHFNHMMIHALAYLSGDTQDDHLGHMFCRAMMFYATAKAEEANKDKPVMANPEPLTQEIREELFAEDKPVEPWNMYDDDRRFAICDKSTCESCCFSNKSNGRAAHVDCYRWCFTRPAEARRIMDEWEADHGLD